MLKVPISHARAHTHKEGGKKLLEVMVMFVVCLW